LQRLARYLFVTRSLQAPYREVKMLHIVKKKPTISEPLLRAFCKTVQERRGSLGISQEELAHRAALHRTYISDIERGSRNLSLRSLIRLAGGLETSVSALLRIAEIKAAYLARVENGESFAPGRLEVLEPRSS